MNNHLPSSNDRQEKTRLDKTRIELVDIRTRKTGQDLFFPPSLLSLRTISCSSLMVMDLFSLFLSVMLSSFSFEEMSKKKNCHKRTKKRKDLSQKTDFVKRAGETRTKHRIPVCGQGCVICSCPK
jgi:hypothetical protein